MNQSCLKRAFPHRFELTQILRQEEAEVRFKEALDKLRSCRCDDETEQYLCNLSREFPCSSDSLSESPIHIYFKRLPIEVHNATILASLPGPKLSFESLDTGCAKSLNRTISAVIYLKPGCKVMPLYNISHQLRNGTCGKFVAIDQNGEGLVVNFPKVDLVTAWIVKRLDRKLVITCDVSSVLIG